MKIYLVLVLLSHFILEVVHCNPILSQDVNNGPIPEPVFEQYPRLAYLGEFNGKHFYIERTAVNQYAARNNCKAMGMNLAVFDTQEELNFVGASGANDLSWTDGTTPNVITDFQWVSRATPVSSALAFESSFDTLGLVLDVYASTTRLAALNQHRANYYLCYIENMTK